MNDEQERMQWARYFFHDVRLDYLDEMKRKKLDPDIRRALAKEVVSWANCEYSGLKNGLTLDDFIGPAEEAKKNYPADQPKPKGWIAKYILDESYAATRVRVKRDLRKVLREFEAKSNPPK